MYVRLVSAVVSASAVVFSLGACSAGDEAATPTTVTATTEKVTRVTGAETVTATESPTEAPTGHPRRRR